MIIQNLLVTKIKRKIFDYLKIPPKMIRYTNRFNEAGFISFLFKDDEMLRKHVNKTEIKSRTKLEMNLILYQSTMIDTYKIQ